jgi:Dolichyl-phosphate-mannose-protein mannosyltransferase
MSNSTARRAELAFLILLTLGAFAVRAFHVSAVGLAEDEAAKWDAVQDYRQGHFVGVNSGHPMLMKLLAWGSLELGRRSNRWADRHAWPKMSEVGWLRLPNLILGAGTTAALYLLARQMMGPVGAGAAAFFWAFTPLPIALNRVLKEDTPLTFFSLLALYFFWRAKRDPTEPGTRRWLDWSSVSFGLALASKYLIYFFGMNWTIWAIAGRSGLDRKPLLPHMGRMLLGIGVTFVLFNPVILSPAHIHNMVTFVYSEGRDLVHHNGYNLDGHLYLNLAKATGTPYGMPWYFYLWVLGVKTPLAVLAAFLAGAILLLRTPKTMASIYFRMMVLIYLLGLSVMGGKWIRYSLSLLPFVFLAAGYAVEKLLNWLSLRTVGRTTALAYGLAGVALFLWPLADTLAWSPYYSLYLNPVGGGHANAGRFFSPDEIYDLGSREEVRAVCRVSPPGATLAAANPRSARYYLDQFGRGDIQLVPVYDVNYVPRPGDFILLQDSRRYFETQDLFRLLEHRWVPYRDIYVGGVLTSHIYHFSSPALDVATASTASPARSASSPQN